MALQSSTKYNRSLKRLQKDNSLLIELDKLFAWVHIVGSFKKMVSNWENNRESFFQIKNIPNSVWNYLWLVYGSPLIHFHVNSVASLDIHTSVRFQLFQLPKYRKLQYSFLPTWSYWTHVPKSFCPKELNIIFCELHLHLW